MRAFSVSEFTEFLNKAIATAVFPEGVVIEGEVVEYRVSQGKWIWFQLKDEDSIVSCFSTVWQLRTPLEDGMQIRLMGTPKIHVKSGRFSVTVDRVELVGEGALRRSFELLKKKLDQEGLFDEGRKRSLVRFPKSIGVIASKESAAYGDFLRILGDRWGGVDIQLYHSQVQGQGAVSDIVSAFKYFNSKGDGVDALVLTRGGGSLEDLQAFNSEEVARAVFSSKIPVVVAVGHERDESLADFAADVRASTPSNAAERLVPDRKELSYALAGDVQRLILTVEHVLNEKRYEVNDLATQLEQRAHGIIDEFKGSVRRFSRQFSRYIAEVEARKVATGGAAGRLARAFTHTTKSYRERVESQERMLRTVDPKHVLARGYSVVRSKGKILKDMKKLDVGAMVEVQLHEGKFSSEVKKKLA